MTQSLSVWRSMPAHFAASARLMPSSALAIPNRRREMCASGSDLASLRSTVDVRSLRIFSFAIARLLGRIDPTMESELNAAGYRWTATRVELYARRYKRGLDEKAHACPDLWRRRHRRFDRLVPRQAWGRTGRHRADRRCQRGVRQVGRLSRLGLVRRHGSCAPRAAKLRAPRNPRRGDCRRLGLSPPRYLRRPCR